MADLKESALKELRHQISQQSHGKVSHTNLKRTQMKKMSDVSSLVDILDKNWTNPFGRDTSYIVSITTGAVPTPKGQRLQ